MAQRRASISLVIGVVGVTAAAVWAVSARGVPSFARYDSTAALVPSSRPAVPLPLPAAETARRAARPAGLTGRAPVATAAADSADSARRRPHRSDTYGGYSGYGARERRGAPNGK